MNKFILLILIFLLTFLLHFYKLGKIPVSLYWDEVAIGYNAYSISKTGADEYGTKFPLLFRSFDDYKLPGYIYLDALFLKILPPSEFSTRLPAALLGVFAVMFTYLLATRLFSKPKIGLLSSLLLAISPWHLQFSRVAFEASGALTCLIAGVCLTFSRRQWLFWPGIIFFVLSVYFYRTAQLVAPALMLFCLLRSGWKKTFFGLALFVLLTLPIYTAVLFGAGSGRFNQVSIFSAPAKKTTYLKIFTQNYFSHFSPNFVLLRGDPNEPRHGVLDSGEFYFWEIPAIIGGLYLALKKRRLLLPLWFFLGPLPAALTLPVPHALRALNILPAPQILASLVLSRLSRTFLFLALFSLAIVISTYHYLFSYYISTPLSQAPNWADGQKQLVSYVQTQKKTYSRFIISGHYWKPYIFFLFYEPVNPEIYQKLGTEKGLAQYYFGGVEWGKGEIELNTVNLKSLSQNKKTLVALSPQEYSSQKNNLVGALTIKDHAGNTVYVVSTLK